MASVDEPGHCEVRSWPDRDRVIVTVVGELDMLGAETVQATLDELHAAGWDHVVLDLRALTFIDSTGLSLLLRADRAARRDGASFAVMDGSPAFARLLEIIGLEGHFTRAQPR